MLLFLFACSEYEIKGEKEAPLVFEEAGEPDIEVDPPALDFGVVNPDDGPTEARLVAVSNRGEADLTITSAEVTVGSPFTVTALDGATVAPGDTVSYSIQFDPSQGTTEDTFTVTSNDPDEAVVAVPLTSSLLYPDITVEPTLHDFGTLAYAGTGTVAVTVRNDGGTTLTISGMTYTTGSPGELSLRDAPSTTVTLAPGASTIVNVDYAPTDNEPDEGFITVLSDDPDEREALATQIGNAEPWEGFSTGWYIVEDDTAFETTSNPSYVVDHHGDEDGYWYEPSGVFGMVDSADRNADFEVLHDYVIARAGAPTPVTGPLTFRASSTIPCQSYASFNYILADFWIDGTDDPDLYEITTGTVDDGIKVIVNGRTVDHVKLGGTGRWNVGQLLRPGEVNSLVVILMDDCAVDKYLNDLAFWRDGVIVTG